jgi:hypothetical protein
LAVGRYGRLAPGCSLSRSTAANLPRRCSGSDPSGVWLSLAEHFVRIEGVAGSNPVTSTGTFGPSLTRRAVGVSATTRRADGDVLEPLIGSESDDDSGVGSMCQRQSRAASGRPGARRLAREVGGSAPRRWSSKDCRAGAVPTGRLLRALRVAPPVDCSGRRIQRRSFYWEAGLREAGRRSRLCPAMT